MSENLTPYITSDGRRLTHGITWEGKLMNSDADRGEIAVVSKQLSYKQDIDEQIKNGEIRLRDLNRVKELLERNPDMQELLTLMSQTNLKRLY